MLTKALEVAERAGGAPKREESGSANSRATNASRASDASEPGDGDPEVREVDLDLVKEVLMRGDAEELEEQLELAVVEIRARRSFASHRPAAAAAEGAAARSRSAHGDGRSARGGVDAEGDAGEGRGRSEGEWTELEERCSEAERQVRRLQQELEGKDGRLEVSRLS